MFISKRISFSWFHELNETQPPSTTSVLMADRAAAHRLCVLIEAALYRPDPHHLLKPKFLINRNWQRDLVRVRVEQLLAAR